MLARLDSAPLADIATVLNKESQNLHAEMLLREVGFARRGVGSFEAGIEELKDFLGEAGLRPWEFRFQDGSGLSRQNLVSPAGTVKLLTHMWDSPLRDAFIATLPVAGEDGTLDWRFQRTSARNMIRAKTGTLSAVTALSGFAETQSGRKLAFGIFVNNFGVPTSYIRKLVDEIAVAIVEATPPAAPLTMTDSQPPAVPATSPGGTTP
jgi:D-alanyl-D-alanine carboxypeptidase/D-alanyl-D-alanine-endopeptidase (penicillin-binding protein 4)